MNTVNLYHKLHGLQKGHSEEDGEHQDQLSRAAKTIMTLLRESKPATDQEHDVQSFHICQAIDFIKATVANLQADRSPEQFAGREDVRALVSSLIEGIVCFSEEGKAVAIPKATDQRFWNLRILIKLSELPLVGQEVLLQSTRQLLERMNDVQHDCKFICFSENAFFILQLVEDICSRQLKLWTTTNVLDEGLLEVWVMHHFELQAMVLEKGQGSLFSMLLSRTSSVIIEVLRSMSKKSDRAVELVRSFS